MKRILAPHREQEGWVYWRLKVTTPKNLSSAPAVSPLWLVKKDTLECVKASDICLAVDYSDDTPGSRIISSRRVEEAVETADFLKLCAEEGMSACYLRDHWLVYSAGPGQASGTTLRTAYYRYKAQIAPVAIEPDYRTCGDCVYEMTSGADEPCLSCVEAGTPDGE